MDDNIDKQDAERGQPARGIATLSMLALIRSHSDALDLLKFFKFSNISDLAIVVPLKCLNLVVRPNLNHIFSGSYTISCAEQFVSSIDAIFVVKLFG